MTHAEMSGDITTAPLPKMRRLAPQTPAAEPRITRHPAEERLAPVALIALGVGPNYLIAPATLDTMYQAKLATVNTQVLTTPTARLPSL